MKTDLPALGLLAAFIVVALCILEAAYAYGGAPLVDRLIGPWGLASVLAPFPLALVGGLIHACEWLGWEP